MDVSRPLNIASRKAAPRFGGAHGANFMGISQSLPPAKPSFQPKTSYREPPPLSLPPSPNVSDADFLIQQFEAKRNKIPRYATSAPTGGIVLSTSFRKDLTDFRAGNQRLKAVMEHKDEEESENLGSGNTIFGFLVEQRGGSINSRTSSPLTRPREASTSSPLMFALTLDEDPPGVVLDSSSGTIDVMSSYFD